MTSIPRTVAALGPLFGGTYAVYADLHPTGDPVADLIWSAVLGAFLAFIASRGNPILWIGCAALTILVENPIGIAAGYGLALIGLWWSYTYGIRRSHKLAQTAQTQLARIASGALSVPILLNLGSLGYPALSAAITGVAALCFFLVAVLSLSRKAKRRIVVAAPFLIALFTAYGLVSWSFVTSLETDVRSAERSAQRSVSALQASEFDVGLDALGETEVLLGQGTDRFSQIPARLLRVTPGAGHNVRALEETLTASHRLVESAVDFGDPTQRLGALFSNGRIDPEQLRLTQADTRQFTQQINDLEHALGNTHQLWLAPPLARDLQQLDSQLSFVFERNDDLTAVADSLQSILGVDSPRRYLVLFGNPAEARELGGFTGATALLSLNQGSFDFETAGRRVGASTRSSAAVLSEAPPVRFLEHQPWRFEPNYSAMADFPTLSRALRDIFPAMGGSQIDGVIYLDPFTLDALVDVTGPIDIESLGRTVVAGEIPHLLLVEQYERYLPGPERDEFFDDLFSGVANAINSGEFNVTGNTVRRVREVIAQDRLLFAPLSESELEVADALGLTGRISPVSSNDYLAISHLNGGANKLDTYLQRTINYDVSIDLRGRLSATAEIELVNQAPSGLPAYAAGTVRDRPGTNRLTVVVHTPHELVSWAGLREEPELVRSFREFDRWRHEAIVVLAPGESRTVALQLVGQYEADSYKLDLGHQPLVTDDEFSVALERNGDLVESRSLTLTEDQTISLPLPTPPTQNSSRLALE